MPPLYGTANDEQWLPILLAWLVLIVYYGGISRLVRFAGSRRAYPLIDKGELYTNKAQSLLDNLSPNQREMIAVMNPTYLSTVKAILRQ